MRLTTSTNYATPAMEITHVVSSDSLELPHVVMQENDSQDHWVAQQVVKGLTTSLVEKAQNNEDCTHLLQNLGNQLTPATLSRRRTRRLTSCGCGAFKPGRVWSRICGRTFAARVYLCACSIGDSQLANWVSQDRVSRVLYWKGSLLALELRDGRRALYDDMRLETPSAESFVNYSWDVRAMLDAFRRIGGRDVLVLGLRSGGILPKTLSESGAKVACAAESPEAVGAAEAFSGWNGPTWYYGGWPNRGEWDCVFVDVDDESAVDAAMRLSRGVCVYGVDASAAQRVAQQCRARGACVDVLNADPYAWESNARAVVVRARRRRSRGRSAGSTTTRRTARSSWTPCPSAGFVNAALAGLAALVDEGEPAKAHRRGPGRHGAVVIRATRAPVAL